MDRRAPWACLPESPCESATGRRGNIREAALSGPAIDGAPDPSAPSLTRLETARGRRRAKLHAEFSVRDASAQAGAGELAGARVRVPRALEFLYSTPQTWSFPSTYQVLRSAGHGFGHGGRSREGGRRRADCLPPVSLP